MASLSLSALRLSIFVFTSLCLLLPFGEGTPGVPFHCEKSEINTSPLPPLAADCLHILNSLPGLHPFESDTGWLQPHATNTAKPLSLKMSLRAKPLPTKGGVFRHGTCRLKMTLHSFMGASAKWLEYPITQKQAHYHYYPEAKILGKELIQKCIVEKQRAGWVQKAFKFPNYIDAAIYLYIDSVGTSAWTDQGKLQVFDV